MAKAKRAGKKIIIQKFVKSLLTVRLWFFHILKLIQKVLLTSRAKDSWYRNYIIKMNDFAHGVNFVWAERLQPSLTDNCNTPSTYYHGTFHLTFIAIQVKYRDVPGIDTAYLAMDTEEGVEVVWNEAQFSGSKKFKAQVNPLKLFWPVTDFSSRSFFCFCVFSSVN